MRVLLVDQTAAFWGGQQVLATALAALHAAGHAVTVMAPGGGVLERRLRRQYGDTLHWLDVPEPRLSTGRRRVWDVVRLLGTTPATLRHRAALREAEVIHVNGPRMLVPVRAALLAAGLRRPFVVHVHVDPRPLEKRFLRGLLGDPHLRGLWTVSRFLHERLVAGDRALAGDARVRVLENGLAPEWSRQAYVDRFAHGVPKRVGIVGRVTPEKGVDVVCEVARQMPDWTFHWVGTGDAGLGSLAGAGPDVPANLHLEGYADAVPAVLEERQVGFVVVPSVWEEPFGLVALEGMAGSYVTWVRPRGGLAEIAQRTGAGVFDTPGDLVRQLREMAQRAPREVAGVAREQHRKTLCHYGFERFARDYLKALEDAART